MEHSSHVAYGIQINLPETLPWWDFNELTPQDGKVVPMNAGQYDNNDYFLAITDTWERIEAGNPRCIGPYLPTDDPYLSWDGLLVAAAEELKVDIVTQPAWMFVPDEC